MESKLATMDRDATRYEVSDEHGLALHDRVVTPQDELTYRIIGLAMDAHTAVGPGFPEALYQRAMEVALSSAELPFEREYPVHVEYQGQRLGRFELDLVVNQQVIVEIKALAALAAVHEQQAIAYLAASGLPIALLLNFGAARLEYKRLFPPKAVQSSSAYQARASARSQS
jgi:GxxExxY protein